MNKLIQLVGENIRGIRKLKNLTQEELAEKCGLQVSYLAGVERGERNITLESLDRIVTGLEVLPIELFLEESRNKDKSILYITELLKERTEQEANLILNISKEIFKIY